MAGLWLTGAPSGVGAIGFLALCLTLPVAPARGASCAIAPLLAGWSGGGVARRDASSPEEVVQCRFGFRRQKETGKPGMTPLTMQLDCRGIDLTFSMTGRLDLSAQTGKIAGTFAAQRRGTLSIQRRGKAKATGACGVSGVALNLVYRNFNTGNIDTIRMTLSPKPKNRLVILTRTVPDGAQSRPVTLFSATMTRQGR